MTTRHTTVATVIGTVTLTATDGAITGVYFPHHWYAPSVETLGEAVELGSDPVLDAARQLVDYLAGNRDGFDLLTQATGDEFENQVLALLDEIPYGQTTTDPGVDHTGGEFILLEQRPRAQSRGSAFTLPQGHGYAFTTRDRPVESARGWSAAPVRHSVSVIRSGERYTLALVLHDAA
jgi:hypothetical protein